MMDEGADKTPRKAVSPGRRRQLFLTFTVRFLGSRRCPISLVVATVPSNSLGEAINCRNSALGKYEISAQLVQDETSTGVDGVATATFATSGRWPISS